MRIVIILFILFSFQINLMFSQTEIEGQVLDVETMKPIQNLTVAQYLYRDKDGEKVIVKTATNVDGKFNIVCEGDFFYLFFENNEQGYKREIPSWHLKDLMKTDQPILLKKNGQCLVGKIINWQDRTSKMNFPFQIRYQVNGKENIIKTTTNEKGEFKVLELPSLPIDKPISFTQFFFEDQINSVSLGIVKSRLESEIIIPIEHIIQLGVEIHLIDEYTELPIPNIYTYGGTPSIDNKSDELGIARVYLKNSNTIRLEPSDFYENNPTGYLMDSISYEKLEKSTIIYHKMRRKNPSLSYLGYDSDYIPIFSYSFLRKLSQEFIANAVQLEKDLISYENYSSDRQLQQMQVQHAINISNKNVEIAKTKTELSQKSYEIASYNSSLSYLRVEHKRQQIANYTEFHPIAVGRAKETEAMRAAIKNNTGPFNDDPQANKNLNTAWKYTHIAGNFLGETIGTWFGLGNDHVETYFNLKNEKSELEATAYISNLEAKKEFALVDLSSKELERDRIENSQLKNQYELLQTGTLSPEYWNNLHKKANELYKKYLRYGTVLAWLTQRAYEIENLKRVNIINYNYSSTKKLLAAEQLLLDLNSIEFKRVAQKDDRQVPASFVISLRQKNIMDMEKLRKTGKIDFTISQFDLDYTFPGTYRQFINNVDIEVIALSNSTGIKGVLTKHGYSVYRVPKNFAQKNIVDDWIKYTANPYAVTYVSHGEENIIIPKIKDMNTFMKEEGINNQFVGKSLCGSYTLDLPKYSNRFDYNSIVDVIIKFDFSAYYDKDLKKIVQDELCNLEYVKEFPQKEEFSISLSEDLPDENYAFHNGFNDSMTNRYRVFPVYIYEKVLPQNQQNKTLNSLGLSFISQKGLMPVNTKLTSVKMNKNVKIYYENGVLKTFPKTNIEDLNWVSNLNPRDSFTYLKTEKGIIYTLTTIKNISNIDINDTFFILIDVMDNPNFSIDANSQAFDDTKLARIKEVITYFEYSYSSNYCEYQSEIPTLFTKIDTIIIDEKSKNIPYFYYKEEYGGSVRLVPITVDIGSSIWKTDSINGYFECVEGTPKINFGRLNGYSIQGDIDYQIKIGVNDNNVFGDSYKLFEIPKQDGKALRVYITSKGPNNPNVFNIIIQNQSNDESGLVDNIYQKEYTISKDEPLLFSFQNKKIDEQSNQTEMYINGQYTVSEKGLTLYHLSRLNYYFKKGMKYKNFAIKNIR